MSAVAFAALVARFEKEGKPNPERSARASIARRAQMAQKAGA